MLNDAIKRFFPGNYQKSQAVEVIPEEKVPGDDLPEVVESPESEIEQQEVADSVRPEAYLSATNGGSGGYQNYNRLVHVWYDGEIEPGELGTIKHYSIDYTRMRFRSWQAYAESDIAQSIVHRFCDWVIGTGLTLQSTPNEKILASLGIIVDAEEFSQQVEAFFNQWCSDEDSTTAREENLHKQMYEALKTAFLSGDCLLIQDFTPSETSTRLIDGQHIQTPSLSDDIQKAKEKGNEIRHGIEFDELNRHVAYYISKGYGEYEKVDAYNNQGQRVAKLMCGRKYRADSDRGMPFLIAILEGMKALSRYKSASIVSAEERAKVAYFFEHGVNSSGEHVLRNNIKSSVPLNTEIAGASADRYNEGVRLAAKVAASTKKQVFNMTPDSTVKAIDSNAEFNFKDFFETNLEPVCSAIGIPKEVVLMTFTTSYSSSRGAMQMFKQNVQIFRQTASTGYMFVYKNWLLWEVVNNRINALGLFNSFINDKRAFKAYTKAKFIGVNLPHLDPEKEVRAIRAALGPLGAHLPLTSAAAAVQELNAQDFRDVVDKFEKEKDTIDPPEQPIPTPGQETPAKPKTSEE